MRRGTNERVRAGHAAAYGGRMDLLIGLFSVLLAASATMFFWLSVVDGRREAATAPSGPRLALDDLVGSRHPLLPRTIRQTPLY
jgi:hypothetical protein